MGEGFKFLRNVHAPFVLRCARARN